MTPNWLAKAKWEIKWTRNYLKPNYDEIYYTENYNWAFGRVKYTIQWATNVFISRNMGLRHLIWAAGMALNGIKLMQFFFFARPNTQVHYFNLLKLLAIGFWSSYFPFMAWYQKFLLCYRHTAIPYIHSDFTCCCWWEWASERITTTCTTASFWYTCWWWYSMEEPKNVIIYGKLVVSKNIPFGIGHPVRDTRRGVPAVLEYGR